MSSRRDDINEELPHLKNLERLITDQKALDGLKALIADLEGRTRQAVRPPQWAASFIAASAAGPAC
jgi:hypothetical protein